MAAIYPNGGDRWNILGFNFTKRDALSSVYKISMVSTDEDLGLRIESFAVINLRGVSTNKNIICFIAMQTYKELI
jgi:hypothetical protein